MLKLFLKLGYSIEYYPSNFVLTLRSVWSRSFFRAVLFSFMCRMMPINSLVVWDFLNLIYLFRFPIPFVIIYFLQCIFSLSWFVHLLVSIFSGIFQKKKLWDIYNVIVNSGYSFFVFYLIHLKFS